MTTFRGQGSHVYNSQIKRFCNRTRTAGQCVAVQMHRPSYLPHPDRIAVLFPSICITV